MAGHAIAPDDFVRTHEEAAGNERTPLLVLDPLHPRPEQLRRHRSPDLMSAALSTDFTMFW